MSSDRRGPAPARMLGEAGAQPLPSRGSAQRRFVETSPGQTLSTPGGTWIPLAERETGPSTAPALSEAKNAFKNQARVLRACLQSPSQEGTGIRAGGKCCVGWGNPPGGVHCCQMLGFCCLG